jgi:hypothetical protein
MGIGAFSRLGALASVAGLASLAASLGFAQTNSVQPQSLPQRSAKMLDSRPAPLFEKMFNNHKLVGSPGLAWKKQRVISVAFNAGSEPLYRLIEQTANEWTALGGQLSFSFKDSAGRYRQWHTTDTSAAADIRIAFDQTGYWSLLGVLAKNVEPNESTMNYEGFPTELQRYFNGANAAEWQSSYSHSTILHEFGHAIGLSHEHFNPQCQRDLKMAEIIQYLQGPSNGWSEEQARFNMDAQYYVKILAQQAGPLESQLVTSAKTDQSSVMLYLFEDDYYKSGSASPCRPVGDHGRKWATTLSAGDKQFYLTNYRTIASPFSSSAQPKRERM